MKKNIKICLMALLLSLTLSPIGSKAATAVTTTSSPVEVSKNDDPAEVKALVQRLEEIKTMDKTKMKAPEKKRLRQEVKAIKQKLESNSSVVVISGGTLILIIILLIILL